MITILAAAGWLLAQATDPAAIATPPVAPMATTAASTAQADKDKDPIVCRTEVPLGSRLGGKKTCLRKSMWDQQRRDARDAAEAAQRQGAGPIAR